MREESATAVACPAQTLRLDRTKPRLCSAAELAPSNGSAEMRLRQSSPSAARTAFARQVTVPSAPRFAIQATAATCGWVTGHERVVSKRFGNGLPSDATPSISNHTATQWRER